jgi:hypothetical protein
MKVAVNAVVAACALLTTVPSVDAQDVQPVSGIYWLDFSYQDPTWPPYTAVQRSKHVCDVRMGSRFVLEGADPSTGLSGNLDVVLSINLKGPCDGDWSQPATIHGKGTFTGTLRGEDVAFDVNMVAKHEQDWVAHGQWVIQHGRGVHGILRFSGFVGWGGTFLGELRFTP